MSTLPQEPEPSSLHPLPTTNIESTTHDTQGILQDCSTTPHNDIQKNHVISTDGDEFHDAELDIDEDDEHDQSHIQEKHETSNCEIATIPDTDNPPKDDLTLHIDGQSTTYNNFPSIRQYPAHFSQNLRQKTGTLQPSLTTTPISPRPLTNTGIHHNHKPKVFYGPTPPHPVVIHPALNHLQKQQTQEHLSPHFNFNNNSPHISTYLTQSHPITQSLLYFARQIERPTSRPSSPTLLPTSETQYDAPQQLLHTLHNDDISMIAEINGQYLQQLLHKRRAVNRFSKANDEPHNPPPISRSTVNYDKLGNIQFNAHL